MKKRWIFLLVPIPLLFLLILIARVTGALQFYRSPTPSSEPTIMTGRFFFTSNFKKPEPGDIITFLSSPYHDSIVKMGTHRQNHVYRLVAKEGDVIEMRNAVFFVNRKNFDADKNLKHNYIADKAIIEEIKDAEEKELKGELRMISDNQCEIFLTSTELKAVLAKGVKIEKVILNSVQENYGAFAWMKKDSSWTVDQFGPIKIPMNCYFVLGDNRHNALDSRYVGFVNKENFTGTVIGIK